MECGDGAPISPSLGWQSLATEQAERGESVVFSTNGCFSCEWEGAGWREGCRREGEEGRTA